MSFLFLFLDGVGLGPDNPTTNPFAAVKLPNLEKLLGGNRMLQNSMRYESEAAVMVPLDAGLGIPGIPQSATGQATLITGRNVPAEIGRHYGPKPDPEIRSILKQANLFKSCQEKNLSAALLNAYPPGYFEAIESGRRLYSAIPMAVDSAGISLKTKDDYYAGQAMAADFTGEGWRTFLKFQDAPTFDPRTAGQILAEQAQDLDFAFFEFWISDYIGHRQDWEAAEEMLVTFDQVLGGLLDGWNSENGLIFLTSDHGNLEDLSTRRHTTNQVPGLVIGSPERRNPFAEQLKSLADVAPAIENFISSRESNQ
jgi:hypothetical protein